MSALKPDGQGNHDLGTTDNRWGALHVQTIATSGDVSVGGALSVSGGITTVKEQELIIGDSMIQLGDGETTNSKDIGFFGEYNDGSAQTFAGLVYDQSASKFFLFSALESQPSDTINTGHATFTKATLDLADIDTATFTATGAASLGSTLGVTGAVTLASTLDVDGNTTLDGLAVSEAATFTSTLGVTGETTLASAIISDLTSGRVVLAGTSGAVEDSDKLTFNGSALGVDGTLSVTGETTLASAIISDLTSGRVVLAGTSGAVEDSTKLTFDGTTLALTGAATISSTLSAAATTLSSAKISDLTSGRVVLAGADGEVEDNNNLRFDGSELTVTGTAAISSNATVGGTLGVSGASTLASVGVTNNATVGGTLGVTGEASLDGGIDVDESGSSVFSVNGATGNTSVGGTLAVTSNATVGGTLGVTGEASLDGGIDVGESGSSVFSVNGTTGNTAIVGTLDVDGNTTLDGLAVSEAATFASTLGVSGASTLASVGVTSDATVGGTLGVTGESTLASAIISDLTSGRVVLAGTAGAVEDSDKLTFNGTTLALTGAATVSTDLTVSGDLDVDGTTSLDGVSVDGSSTLTGAVGITGTTTLNSASDLIIKDNAGTPATVFSVTGASGNTTIAGTLGVTGNTTIGGNLTVNGLTTTVNSTTVTIDDPIFTLGGDTAPASDDNLDRGIEFKWHNGSSAKVGFFGYDDSAERFTFIKDATNTSEVFSGTAGDVAFGAGQFSSMLASNVQIGNTANTVDTLTGNLILKSASGQKVQIDNILQVIGAATLDSTLLVTGEASLDGGIDVDESGSSVFSVNGATGNTAIAGTLGVTGESTLASATISDLTSGRVVLAGTSGAVEDSTKLTFDGSELTVTGTAAISSNATVGGTLGVTGATTLSSTLSAGETTLSSATISDLTSGRVVLAGTSGAVEDNDNLRFDGSELTVTGTAAISSNATVGGTLGVTGATTLDGLAVSDAATFASTLGVTGESTLASAIISDLTSGRVVLAGTAGAVEDSDKLTFDGSALGVTGTAAISSNATVGGTLGVTGATTLSSTLGLAGNLTVNSDKFAVTASSGNTAMAGSLTVGGTALIGGTLSGDGASFTSLTVSGLMTGTGDNLSIADPLVLISSSGNINKDIGVYAERGSGSDNDFLGLIYDQSQSRFRLWQNMKAPNVATSTFLFGDSGDNADSLQAPLEVGYLYVTNLEQLSANQSSGQASVSTHATLVTTGNDGSNDTITLADGVHDGQIKVIALDDDGGDDLVVTVTTAAWSSGTITLNTVGQACTLQWLNSKWFCTGNNGCSFA